MSAIPKEKAKKVLIYDLFVTISDVVTSPKTFGKAKSILIKIVKNYILILGLIFVFVELHFCFTGTSKF